MTAARARRVGVIGSFVWDEIHGRDPAQAPIEEWGGIAYALAALDSALSDDWQMVPLVRVGTDLAFSAREWMRELKRLAADAALIEVPHANNRVTLRYDSSDRRTEQLRGGIPGWSWLGLKPLLRNLDALYVNLISGFELDLETAQLIRQNFAGPIYCDLHSLTLAVNHDGLRVPQPVPNIAHWLQCFDLLQVNEDEMRLLASDSLALAATAMAAGVSAVNVTLGPNGMVYFAAPRFERLSDMQRTSLPASGALGGAIRTARVSATLARATSGGDPTGCGDVWGATYFARLLAGDMLGDATGAAMRAAARNVDHRGATGLASYLRGELTVA